jgi:CBS domain-containing protein
MQIREIMTREVDVIPPNASIRDVASKMKELDVEQFQSVTGRS